jgi:hypothetical protein
MSKTSRINHSEGLRVARLFMVLSSISPLFILWAIRGSKVVPDEYFIPLCALAVIIPNAVLFWRYKTARKLHETRELTIGIAEDHRGHLLVYLFAMLIPLYATDLGDPRDMAAALAAVALIVVLFYRLNLHYTNIVFTILSYYVFTVRPRDGHEQGATAIVLITKRQQVDPGAQIVAYRLSDTVYVEAA